MCGLGDLNEANLKDDFPFPLPYIDVVTDSTIGHAMFSNVVGFSGYNQIKRQTKIEKRLHLIITPWGTFCCNVMAFDLKMLKRLTRERLQPFFMI